MFIFLFICALLVPLSMIILGKRWSKNPPVDRNGFSGYRTNMSRLNEDTWTLAHRYWGKVNALIGIVLIAFTIVFMVYIRNNANFENLVTGLVFIQLLFMAFTIIPTEIKLNHIFDKRGYRK